MSKDYECLVGHTVINGETVIRVRVREGPSYEGDMALTVKRAKRPETAALRALKSFLILD